MTRRDAALAMCWHQKTRRRAARALAGGAGAAERRGRLAERRGRLAERRGRLAGGVGAAVVVVVARAQQVGDARPGWRATARVAARKLGARLG